MWLWNYLYRYRWIDIIFFFERWWWRDILYVQTIIYFYVLFFFFLCFMILCFCFQGKCSECIDFPIFNVLFLSPHPSQMECHFRFLVFDSKDFGQIFFWIFQRILIWILKSIIEKDSNWKVWKCFNN